MTLCKNYQDWWLGYDLWLIAKAFKIYSKRHGKLLLDQKLLSAIFVGFICVCYPMTCVMHFGYCKKNPCLISKSLKADGYVFDL